jgi:hypothetical protein
MQGLLEGFHRFREEAFPAREDLVAFTAIRDEGRSRVPRSMAGMSGKLAGVLAKYFDRIDVLERFQP